MKSLATNHRRRIPWARRALGMFVVVWLNLVLQPCAMAFSSNHHGDCPNCPPAAVMKHHDGHEMRGAGAMDHDMPCAGGMADCSVADELNYDGRTAKLKVKNSPDNSPSAMLPVASLSVSIRAVRHTYQRPKERHPPGPSRALNKLYCVYLK